MLNGIQEANEPAVGGVHVEAVVKATGAIMSEAVTAVDGSYKLENIEKADVFMRFNPTGYGATLPRVTDDALDSDVTIQMVLIQRESCQCNQQWRIITLTWVLSRSITC